jgi:hypothetical protein
LGGEFCGGGLRFAIAFADAVFVAFGAAGGDERTDIEHAGTHPGCKAGIFALGEIFADGVNTLGEGEGFAPSGQFLIFTAGGNATRA